MLTEKQQELIDGLVEITDEYGKFGWGIDGDGSHYTPAENNPFKAEGLVCKNCVFFAHESYSCSIVSGKIDEEAICKFWIIENEELNPEIPMEDDPEEEEPEEEESAAAYPAYAAKYDKINFSPPSGVKSAAKRGLALHEKGLSGKGLESATVLWARKYTQGEAVSPARARMGNRFFGRNSRFANAPKDSPAWVSWLLWGGAAGRAWFAKLVRQMDAADKKSSASVKGSLHFSESSAEHPFVREVELILTDFEPNKNGEAIPRAEAENIIRTAVNTPLKINAFISENVSFYEGHSGAHPIGAISSAFLDTVDGREVIKAKAYIWKQEFPGIYNLLKAQHGSSSFIGTSWELYYTEVDELQGVRWLKNVTFAGTCIVDTPAYGQRTPLLSVAEEKMNKLQEELQQALDALKQQEETLNELRQQVKAYQEAEHAAAAEARKEKVAEALREVMAAAEVEKRIDFYVGLEDSVLEAVLTDMAKTLKREQASQRETPATPALPEPQSAQEPRGPQTVKALAEQLRQLKNSK